MKVEPCSGYDDTGCHRGEDGGPCAQCEAWEQAEAAYWRAYFKGRPREQTREEYAQDVHDSGRGHLLNEEEAALVDGWRPNR